MNCRSTWRQVTTDQEILFAPLRKIFMGKKKNLPLHNSKITEHDELVEINLTFSMRVDLKFPNAYIYMHEQVEKFYICESWYYYYHYYDVLEMTLGN